MPDRRGGQWKKYVGYGLTAFVVLAAAVVIVFIFVRHEDFAELTGKIWKALSPVAVGAVMAYLMNPIMKFFEKKISSILCRLAGTKDLEKNSGVKAGTTEKKGKRIKKISRAISILLTVILVLLLIAFLLYLLIPQLVSTITDLVNDLPEISEKVTNWYYGLEIEKTYIGEYMDIIFLKVSEFVDDFVQNRLVSTATNVLSALASGVWSVLRTLYNIVIGLIFAIYMLSAKEKLAAISTKLLYATFKRKQANRLLRLTRACSVKFIGSIGGKAVDSVIIGLICFVAMSVMGLPYVTLISVIVGVTNVIPFFGPFIGAIPSALLILLVSPRQCLYFLIMILILQQFDGNILTPKIVGEAVELSPLWVLFACTVFGSLWGVVGMLIGVPLMASIYMIVKEITEEKLYNKGLWTSTDAYKDLDPGKVDEKEVFCKVVEVVPGQEPEGLPHPDPILKHDEAETAADGGNEPDGDDAAGDNAKPAPDQGKEQPESAKTAPDQGAEQAESGDDGTLQEDEDEDEGTSVFERTSKRLSKLKGIFRK